jgi:hypothetical protein
MTPHERLSASATRKAVMISNWIHIFVSDGLRTKTRSLVLIERYETKNYFSLFRIAVVAHWQLSDDISYELITVSGSAEAAHELRGFFA